MKTHDVTPSTVREIIAKLQMFPQHLPCYVRPKYHGTVNFCDDVSVVARQISEMHPENEPDNVTFLL